MAMVVQNNLYKEYVCLNKDFNTGMRFKVPSKRYKINKLHIKDTNYYKYCSLGHIKDCSGIVV